MATKMRDVIGGERVIVFPDQFGGQTAICLGRRGNGYDVRFEDGRERWRKAMDVLFVEND